MSALSVKVAREHVPWWEKAADSLDVYCAVCGTGVPMSTYDESMAHVAAMTEAAVRKANAADDERPIRALEEEAVRLPALPVKDEPAAVQTSTVHYSRDLGRAPIVNPAPEGWDERDWHTSGVGDTGTSHVRVGRPYVVACQWCPEIFLAETAAGALSMFRAHESLMLGYRTEGERG